MLKPGDLVYVNKDGWHLTKPRRRLSRSLVCLVLSTHEVGFGTRGTKYLYTFLSEDSRILTFQVDNAQDNYYFNLIAQ